MIIKKLYEYDYINIFLPFLMGGMLEYTKDRIEGSSSGTINGIEREPKDINDNYNHMKYFKLIIKDTC